jgi:hypothetical protein
MPLTPSEKQAAYRARKRAAKAQAALPTPEQIIEREEATEQVENLARAAGVPRGYPLSVWKRAAQHFIQGDGKVQAKVKALRLLCQSDNTTRKAVKDWVRADKSEAARKYVQAQGWELATEAKPQSLADRMVACIEAGKRLEGSFTPEELASPAPPDPVHDKMWADYQNYLQTGKLTNNQVTHLCNHCGGPVTRTIGTAHYCDKHANAPTQPQVPAPPDPLSPGDYANRGFDVQPGDSPRVAALKSIRAALQGNAYPTTNTPTVGPVPDNSVFINTKD